MRIMQKSAKIFNRTYKNIKVWCKKLILKDNVGIANLLRFLSLFAIIFLLTCNAFKNGNFKFQDYFSESMIMSFLLVFVCNVLAIAISNWIKKLFKDKFKLTEKYDELVKNIVEVICIHLLRRMMKIKLKVKLNFR